MLRAGSNFCFEEIAGHAYRSLLPIFTDGSVDPRGTGFEGRAFLGELEAAGLTVGTRHRGPTAVVYSGVVGDLIGVGVRSARRA